MPGRPAPTRGQAADTTRRRGSTTIVVALATVCMALAHGRAAGQPEPDVAPGRLVGEVLEDDSSRPIADVAISLRVPARTTLTDRDGRFRFRDLPAGRHELTLRHVGYGERTIEVEVVPGRTTELTIHLPPVAIQVEPLAVRVEGRLRPRYLEERGFYERQEAGWGLFWDPVDMERASTGIARFRPEEFFRIFGHWDPWRLARRRNCRSPALYVNGHPDDAGLLESNLLSAAEIGAIEVYRDTHGVPAWALDGEAACGVVAVWLKRWE